MAGEQLIREIGFAARLKPVALPSLALKRDGSGKSKIQCLGGIDSSVPDENL